MPFFDYKCSCGYVREMLTKGEKEKFCWCDNCGQAHNFKKQLSAPVGFILKGQGFYRGSPQPKGE